MTTESWPQWSKFNPFSLPQYVTPAALDCFSLGLLPKSSFGEDRLAHVRHLYEAMVGQNIYYGKEKYDSNEAVQRIRSPVEIAQDREGTCLDLALLFAGISLGRELLPILILLEDHALIAVNPNYDLHEGQAPHRRDISAYNQSPVEDLETFNALATSNGYICIEVIGFARDPHKQARLYSFDESIQIGKERLKGNFRCAIDVSTAHYYWRIQPLLLSFEMSSLRSIFRCWLAQERMYREQILERSLNKRPTLTESPLKWEWQHFCEARAWHDELRDHLSSASANAANVPPFKTLADRIRSIDYSQPYRLLRSSLRWVNTVVPDIQRLIGRLTEAANAKENTPTSYLGDSGPEGELKAARYLRKDLLAASEMLTVPRFGRCFLVMGSPGSGKTHFIHTVSIEEEERADIMQDIFPQLLLRLDPPSDGQSLSEKTLLDRVDQLTSSHWPSLSELDDYLGQIPRAAIKIFVVIDNLEAWIQSRSSYLQEIIDLIETTTRYPSIHWLLTVNESSLTTISHFAETWAQYSSVDSLTTRAARALADGIHMAWQRNRLISAAFGWIHLDELNRRTQMGLEIITKELAKREESQRLAFSQIPSEDVAVRQVSNPFVAWVLLDLPGEINLQKIVNLNYIDLVEKYWSLRRKQAGGAPIAEEDLQTFVRLLAGMIAESGDLMTQRRRIVSDAKESAPDIFEQAAHVYETLSFLDRLGFLSLDIDLAAKAPGPQVRISTSPFWSLYVAERLRGDVRVAVQQLDGFTEILREWTQRAKDDYLQEGATEFLILLVERQLRSMSSGENIQRSLWSAALTGGDVPSTAGWFAAAKVDVKAQKLALSFARTEMKISSERELFSILHFFSEVSSAALKPWERAHYIYGQRHEIVKHPALLPYFVFVLSDVFDQIEVPTHLLPVLGELHGCEEVDDWIADTTDGKDRSIIAEQLALAAAEAIHRVLCEAKDMLDLLTSYAQQEETIARKEKGMPPRRRWPRSSFRAWVIFFTLDAIRSILAEEGMFAHDFFHLLDKRNWYRPAKLGLGRNIAMDLEVEGNLAVGYWYRVLSGDSLQTESFLRWIEKLTDSLRLSRRKLAFHIIRHTKPILDNGDVYVDAIFHPLLEKLYLDVDFDLAEGGRLSQIFPCNLRNFTALRRKRQAALAPPRPPQGKRRRQTSSRKRKGKRGPRKGYPR